MAEPTLLPAPLSRLRVVLRVRRELREAVAALRRAALASETIECGGVFLCATYNELANAVEAVIPHSHE